MPMRKKGKHIEGQTGPAVPEQDQAMPAPAEEKAAYDPLKDAYDWIHCIVVAVILCVLLFVLAARVIDVVGPSMLPTLEEGDKIIITRLAGDYEQGDIVVLKAKEFKKEPIVKRIVATGGQKLTIDFAAGTLSVDGKVMNEPYILERTIDRYDVMDPLYYDTYGIEPETDVTKDSVTVTVPEGQLFVMGDNRNNSSDSRVAAIGYVDERDVMGKVVFRIYPFEKVGAIYGVRQSDG